MLAIYCENECDFSARFGVIYASDSERLGVKLPQGTSTLES
jgi:hypothetical protein